MQEFDIYLRSRRQTLSAPIPGRLFEADILLRNLTFWDSLTITSRMSILSAVTGVEMRMSFWVASRLGVKADLSGLTSTAFTGAGSWIGIEAGTDLPTIRYGILTPGVQIGVAGEVLGAVARSMTSASDAIALTAYVQGYMLRTSLGSAVSKLGIEAAYRGDKKRAFETVESRTEIGAEVEHLLKRVMEQFSDRLSLTASLGGLFYTLYMSAADKIGLAAALDDVMIRGSLGSASTQIGMSALAAETMTVKRLSIANEAGLACSASLLSRFDLSAESVVGLTAAISTTLRRYRLLNELDGGTLADIDGMTLGELDYIELSTRKE